MNLYECEGKKIFSNHGISIPAGLCIHRGENVKNVLDVLNVENVGVVAKAQILSGKRGKNGGVRFCSNVQEVETVVNDMFDSEILDQYVAEVRIEEKLDIAEEHYLSITYDTNAKTPTLIYSREGGMDIEDVSRFKITDKKLQIKEKRLPGFISEELGEVIDVAQKLWECFLENDCRLVELNPLVKTRDGRWIAADAKVAIDDDAFFRHEEWRELTPRTEMGRPPTEREIKVRKIDDGDGYYRGTAGKYIEMDGDIALMLIGGGASIANMDVLNNIGLKAANYTEYSGNPPREKVYELTKIVLSKPGLRGLWMCGVVSNFTNVRETFLGFADALDEIKPKYPIVIRRDGPEGEAGRQLIRECAERNGLNMKIFGKEVPMTETAKVLADMIGNKESV